MRLRGHGPGFRFHPTDEEVIVYYLQRKVMGRKFHLDGIQERDVYNLNPRDLKGAEHWKRDLKWYFFSPRERKYSTGERTNRSTKHGFWKTTGKDRPVYHEGKLVGMIKSLIFHERKPIQAQRTDWVMHEYKLLDEYVKQLGCGEVAFVLCAIFEKEGPGPRNGAQYGAHYREEDWDDANEEQDNHEENTQGVGALTLVRDSIDEGNSAVPFDFDWTDIYCVGSSSRTLPSNIDHSVNEGFQSTPVLGTAVESQMPLTDKCGISICEVLSASFGHEQVKDIGVELAIPANEENIYGKLEDLFRLDDLTDYGVIACDNDSVANQKIPKEDDYMEVADCQDVPDSFEGSRIHDHTGPEQPTCLDTVIPDGVPNPTFVGQQNSSVGISDINPSWNRHFNESAQMDRFIGGTQTDTSSFRCGNFPDSSSSEFHGPYPDQQFPVSEGPVWFNIQESGGYDPFWQHHPFSDGICFEDFGDDVSYFDQHNQLAAEPIGFDGWGFGENLLYSNPQNQFAQGTNEFVSRSLRENVSPLHGLQLAEDSAGLGGQGSEQNVQYLNQHPQTADMSIELCGQETTANGQMDRHVAGLGGAAPSGNVQPPQSMLRGGCPHYPS